MKTKKINGFGNYGVIIEDVDFNTITNEEWLEIGKIHLENLVTIIKNCNLNYRDTVHWCEKWGPRRHSSMITICKHYPSLTMNEVINLAIKDSDKIENDHKDTIKTYFQTRAANGVQRVTDKKKKNGENIGMFPEGELLWHSNEASNPIFAPGVALLGSENMVGSSTGFLQTADYYESVSDSFRSELDEMVLIHKWQEGKIHKNINRNQDNLMKINMAPEEQSRLPMVIQSPGGIRGLHYSLNTVWQIEGMSKKESNRVFQLIQKDLVTDKYIWDYWYENDNDWLFFDNSIVNHRRLGKVKNRLAYRTQHSYENIQIKNYNPYFQKEFANIYDKKLTELENFMENL